MEEVVEVVEEAGVTDNEKKMIKNSGKTKSATPVAKLVTHPMPAPRKRTMMMMMSSPVPASPAKQASTSSQKKSRVLRKLSL